MYSQGTKKPRISFFMSMGLIGLFAVFVGFAKTFIIPSANGSFKAPLFMYFHGAFAFSWICLFFIQATLMHYDNFRLHRAFGFFGVFIALGVTLTTLMAGMYLVQKDLDKGVGEASYANIFGEITVAIIFLTLVGCAIYFRKRPQIHKRLMLLATILILWPAWFRFRHYFPSVPRPDIWFGTVLPYSFIIISWIRDKYVNGRLHPVLGWVGAFIIIEQSMEVVTFHSLGVQYLGKEIFTLLSKL